MRDQIISFTDFKQIFFLIGDTHISRGVRVKRGNGKTETEKRKSGKKGKRRKSGKKGKRRKSGKAEKRVKGGKAEKRKKG